MVKTCVETGTEKQDGNPEIKEEEAGQKTDGKKGKEKAELEQNCLHILPKLKYTHVKLICTYLHV